MQQLAEVGASVAALEIDEASARVAADELAQTGIESRAYPTDVAQREQVDDAAYITGSVHTIDRALTSIPAG